MAIGADQNPRDSGMSVTSTRVQGRIPVLEPEKVKFLTMTRGYAFIRNGSKIRAGQIRKLLMSELRTHFFTSFPLFNYFMLAEVKNQSRNFAKITAINFGMRIIDIILRQMKYEAYIFMFFTYLIRVWYVL